MAVKEDMDWSAEEEVQLFLALGGLKPIGINKYFNMACICERLSNALKREIPAEIIWTHLKTMYNLDVLDKMEPVPFPVDIVDFELPPDEFETLIMKRNEDAASSENVAVRSRTSTPQPQSSSSNSKASPNNMTKIIPKSTTQSVSTTAKPSSNTNNASGNVNNINLNNLNISSTAKPFSPFTSTATPVAKHQTPLSKSSSASIQQLSNSKDFDKKINPKMLSQLETSSRETPKRTPKRTRGSMSIESNSSPSTTPPPTQTKRRRI